MRRAILAITLISAFLLCGCYTASTEYYVKDQMTNEMLESRLGKPARIDKLDVDTEKWIYPIDNPELTGYKFYLVRDGKVLDSGIGY